MLNSVAQLCSTRALFNGLNGLYNRVTLQKTVLAKIKHEGPSDAGLERKSSFLLLVVVGGAGVGEGVGAVGAGVGTGVGAGVGHTSGEDADNNVNVSMNHFPSG